MSNLLNRVRVFKFRRLRWAGNVARMKEYRNAFKILTVTATGKRLLRRPRRIVLYCIILMGWSLLP